MQKILNKLSRGKDLKPKHMARAMNMIMDGEATDAQIGGFLMALRLKGETTEEIATAASVMRERAVRVDVGDEHLIDTCGTGGDSKGSFNISTASAFLAAEAGARVAKHGNRSVSSKSGSADVLETAGFNLNLNADQVAECINRFRIGFLFAPAHHGATRHAVGPRRELGVRTLFNLLGPITNPALAPNQVMGVYDNDWVRPIARVLRQLGSRHVMVVHSLDGMDELSTSAPTLVSELKDSEISDYSIYPEDFSISIPHEKALRVDDATQSLQKIETALTSVDCAEADIVGLNAAAAIYVSGIEPSMEAAYEKAMALQKSGAAWLRLQQLSEFTQSL